MTTRIINDQSIGFSREKQKEIEDHKKIAIQLKEASELHLIAVTQLENNDQEQAFYSVVSAYGILGLAREYQKIILNHAINS